MSSGLGFGRPSSLSLELVAPAGAQLVDVPSRRTAQRARWRELGALPAGTPVVLCDARPGARGRCRRLASRAGVRAEHAYLALPSLRQRLLLVEDRRGPLRYACRTLLSVPPGTTRLAAPLGAALALLRLPAVWRLLGAVVPGRVVIGWRA